MHTAGESTTSNYGRKSPLVSIALRECLPVLDLDPPSWRFPCGLVIADELACSPIPFVELLLDVHLRHHADGHLVRAWTFETHSEWGSNWQKITVSCSCKP